MSGYYYVAESGFNPNPQATDLAGLKTCSASLGACPGFSLSAVGLRVTYFTDATSQVLTFAVLATTPNPISQLEVYIDNVSLGVVQGPFNLGTPKLVGLGVPTTITVVVGQTYTVLVGGSYMVTGGSAQSEYWQTIGVVASGG